MRFSFRTGIRLCLVYSDMITCVISMLLLVNLCNIHIDISCGSFPSTKCSQDLTGQEELNTHWCNETSVFILQ